MSNLLNINGKELKSAIKKSSLTQENAANKLGISRQTLNTWFKNDRLSEDTLHKIKRVLDINLFPQTDVKQSYITVNSDSNENITPNENDNLIGKSASSSNAVSKGGTIPPLLPYEFNLNNKFVDLGDGRLLMVIRKVPEQARMGYAAGWGDPEFIETLDYHTLIVDKRHAGNYMAFEAVGDSMENYTTEELAKESIPNGSTVTGREIQRHLWKGKFHNHKWPDFIVVFDDGIVIKRLIDHDVENGIITLHSLNPNKRVYPDKSYSLNDVKQIFNVIEVSTGR